MIKRSLEKVLQTRIHQGKALIILGPRQSGKTTLVKEIIKTNDFNDQTLWLNGDESDVRSLLQNPTSTKLKTLIGNHQVVVIDEAQRIENIGICLKLIVDNIEGIQVIATGSSAFELANKINEPLTGRKWEYKLFPLSTNELIHHFGFLEESRQLTFRLIYGSYPEVVTEINEKENILKQLSDSYLFKDILSMQNIQKADRLERLLQALAFQVGSQVSYHELGQLSGLNNETVEKYIDLLEKAYIVFRLGTYKRNLRRELKRTRKIYFYDNGIRNAVVSQFNPIELRNDIGALWENYLITERWKFLLNNEIYVNRYFWRTDTQQEIDYLEERNGQLSAYEFKWNTKAKNKFPKTFTQAYPEAQTKVITPDNYLEFLTEY